MPQSPITPRAIGIRNKYRSAQHDFATAAFAFQRATAALPAHLADAPRLNDVKGCEELQALTAEVAKHAADMARYAALVAFYKGLWDEVV